MAYDVYSPFDLQQHKDTFVNYLEVVVHPSGLVEYAVPSHQDKLLYVWALGMELITTEDDWFEVRYSRWFMETLAEKFSLVDYNEQLQNATGCVSVWSRYISMPDSITQEQKDTLTTLVREGILDVKCLPLIELQEVKPWPIVHSSGS